MSDNRDLDSVVTVSADGISVQKRFDGEQFAVPAIEFVIESTREDAATIHLVDHVPEDFPMDSVGFHPEYENDNWTAYKDHRVQFERVIEPGETVVTVYGVRLSDTGRATDFMGEPELAEVVPESADVPPDPLASVTDGPRSTVEDKSITDIVSERGNQVVRDVIAGERDSLPGFDDADEPAEVTADADPLAELREDEGSTIPSDPLGDPAVEPVDESEPLEESVNDPVDESEPLEESVNGPVDQSEPVIEPTDVGGDQPVEDGSDDQEEPEEELVVTESSLPADGNVGAALATEIRQGSISEADLTLLRQELDVAIPESTNVRIRHLQSRVEDLMAYTEALEEFIDKHGTGEQIVERFDGFEDDLDDVRETVTSLETEVGDVSGVEEDLEVVAELETAVEELTESQAETAERLDGVEADLEAFSEKLDASQERIDEVHTELDGVGGLESSIESLRADLDELTGIEEQLSDLDSIRSDIAAARGGIEELEELVGANTEDLTTLSETLANVEAELAGVTDVEGDLASIDERVERLADSLSETERTLESTVADLQDDVETINDDIEEIRTWRDQLTSVFGANSGD